MLLPKTQNTSPPTGRRPTEGEKRGDYLPNKRSEKNFLYKFFLVELRGC